MVEQSSVLPRISHPRRISWVTIFLALLTAVAFIAVSRPDMGYYAYSGMGGSFRTTSVDPAVPQMMDVSGVSYTSNAVPSSAPPAMMDNAMYERGVEYDPYYLYPSPNASAKDTRELLKVNYSAAMQTRDVQGLTRRVETTVRGHGGRIDQISSASEYGYVSFVVPVSKYEVFRTELETLVGSRFLTVDIQSQNMLPQKQSIEEQEKHADSSLAEFKTARQKIVNAHSSAVKSLQSQIDSVTEQLTYWRAQMSTYDTQTQIQTLSNELSMLKSRLTNENASYADELKNADANISYAEEWKNAVTKQDTALMDDIATVNGSVSISWIGLWEVAQLFLPGYWIPGICALLTILSYLSDRRRFGTI